MFAAETCFLPSLGYGSFGVGMLSLCSLWKKSGFLPPAEDATAELPTVDPDPGEDPVEAKVLATPAEAAAEVPPGEVPATHAEDATGEVPEVPAEVVAPVLLKAQLERTLPDLLLPPLRTRCLLLPGAC